MTANTPSAVKSLQDSFAHEMANDLPRGWDSFNLHYENCYFEGEQMEKYTCHFFKQGVRDSDFDLTLEAADILAELQQEMSGLGTETWTHLDFSLLPNGVYEFNFGYGLPPLAAESLRHASGGA